jgi:hypothetical protein
VDKTLLSKGENEVRSRLPSCSSVLAGNNLPRTTSRYTIADQHHHAVQAIFPLIFQGPIDRLIERLGEILAFWDVLKEGRRRRPKRRGSPRCSHRKVHEISLDYGHGPADLKRGEDEEHLVRGMHAVY